MPILSMISNPLHAEWAFILIAYFAENLLPMEAHGVGTTLKSPHIPMRR